MEENTGLCRLAETMIKATNLIPGAGRFGTCLKPVSVILMGSFLLLFSIFSPAVSYAGKGKDAVAEIRAMIGKNDSILVEDRDGKVLLSKNADKKRTPASILKVFTSLLAFHYLGETYQFPTEFYLDPEINLTVKGYGDPQLLSESLAEIAGELKRKDEFKTAFIRDIVLDDTFFRQPIEIPGIEKNDYNPYNSPNGALCVNFNTVYFRQDNEGGYVSAEPQTPLLPFVIDRIKASPFSHERIILSSENHDNLLYTGHLLKYFLEKEGIQQEGNIRTGGVDPAKDKILHTHLSSASVREAVKQLLYYSNNFMTNQLLLSVGAKVYGPPGDLEKGLRVARDFARTQLKLSDFEIAEGSGISRKNQVSAKTMMRILRAFEPHVSLLKTEGCEAFKTGSLSGVSTRIGFITQPDDKSIAYVIMMNTQGKSAEAVVKKLKHQIGEES